MWSDMVHWSRAVKNLCWGRANMRFNVKCFLGFQHLHGGSAYLFPPLSGVCKAAFITEAGILRFFISKIPWEEALPAFRAAAWRTQTRSWDIFGIWYDVAHWTLNQWLLSLWSVINKDVSRTKFVFYYLGGFALDLVIFPTVLDFYNSKAFIWGVWTRITTPSIWPWFLGIKNCFYVICDFVLWFTFEWIA